MAAGRGPGVSRPAPARPSSASGSSSPASPTASCGAAWPPPRCSTAATAARAGRWCSRYGTCLSGSKWNPGAGGLCLHSICPWPGDARRLAIGISAGGVWLTEDAGKSWRRAVSGLVPRYLPEEARHDTHMHCVHNMERAPHEPVDPLHAVPRRRVPLRRRRRDLDRHRHRARSALRLRLPAGHRPARPQPRLRHPAGRPTPTG